MKYRDTYNKLNNIKFINKVIIILFIITLIPILAVSFYTHPIYDDYHYSAPLHNFLISGSSIIKAPKVIFEEIINEYYKWQGSYSSILMFQLQPGIISNDAYFLTTFLMMGVFIAGELSLLYTLIVKIFNNKKFYIFLSIILITYKIQYIPRAYDSFYWYNGAVYYTFFYGVTLLMFSSMIKMIFVYKHKSALATFGLILLAFFVAGGSYVSALPSVIVLSILTLYCWCNKNETRIQLTLIFVVYLAGLLISIFSPGNAVRAMGAEQLKPLEAIKMSFAESFRIIHLRNSNIANIVLWIFIIPILYNFAVSSKFLFKHPLLFIAFSFCIYACQLTPSLYGTGIITGYRQWNIFFFNYYWFFGSCLFYIMGYFHKKSLCKIIIKIYAFIQKYILVYCLAFGLMFAISSNGQNILSWNTLNSLKRGDVQRYDIRMDSIHQQLNKSKENVELLDIDMFIPELFDDPFFYGEKGNWLYRWLGEYYGLEVIPVSKYK